MILISKRASASGFLSLGLAVSVAPRAFAAEPVRLEWVRLEGAGDCIDAASLETRVQQRLGTQPFEAQAKRSIEGVIRREGEAWRAEIAVRARADESDPPLRILKSSAPSCASLGDAVVLAVALAIDPEAALASPATGPAQGEAAVATPVTRVAPTRAEAVPAPLPAKLAPAPAPRSRGRVAASALSQLGLLPSLSGGASLFAAVVLGDRFELGLHTRIFPAVHASGETNFEIGAASGALQACVRLTPSGPVAFRSCGGASVGIVHATVLSGERSQPGQRASLGAELGAELGVRLTDSLGLLFGARAMLPLTRYRFSVEGSGRELFRQAAVAGLAHAGLELSLGGRD